MCFTDYDADWYANVVEKTTPTADKPTHCEECGRVIPAGEVYHHTYMQEAEECLACEHGDCLCEGECCQCPEPRSVGETCTYRSCDDCRKFLEAVQAAELDSGCRAHESLPPLGQMIDAIRNGGASEAKKYYRRARVMFPELVMSGYLPRLWRRMFGL